MASNENSTKWVFDLDMKEATEGVLNLQGQISKLGSEENLRGLTDGLMKVSAVAGLLGSAFFALKFTMDQVFEGENIKAINQQFELLTKNAGLAGDAIKDGMVKAAGGLMDDTDLMKIANEAIVKMGDNARKLPEIMELARKATAVYGGELSQNMENITNAIANGNTRMLKQYGIVLDNEKVMRDYAKSIGATVDTLSDSGRQAAVMNAALEKSKTAFQGVNTDIKENQNLFQQLKVTVGEIGEIFTKVFEATAGPILKKFLTEMKSGLDEVKDWTRATFGKWGEDAETTDAQLKKLNTTLADQRAELQKLQSEGRSWWQALSGQDPEKLIKEQEARIVATEGEIKGLQARKQAIEETAEAQKNAENAGPGTPKVDTTKRAEQQAAFEKSLNEMQAKTLQMEEQNATSIEEVDRLHNQRRLDIENDYLTQLQGIKTQEAAGKITPEQAAQMEEQIALQKNQRLIAIDDDLEKKRIDALERFAERNKNTAAGFSAAWAAEAKKAEFANKNFATMGQTAFKTFGDRAVSAFKAVGEGSQTMADAMKGAVLGAIGDMAVAKGSAMLLEGIGTLNPVMAGEGAALVALGSYLQSQAGGGSSVSASSGGGSGGAGSYGGSEQIGKPTEDKPAVQEAKKSVTIQVQGNYFETEQTKATLVDMIKSANDATDYSFKQIGQ